MVEPEFTEGVCKNARKTWQGLQSVAFILVLMLISGDAAHPICVTSAWELKHPPLTYPAKLSFVKSFAVAKERTVAIISQAEATIKGTQGGEYSDGMREATPTL